MPNPPFRRLNYFSGRILTAADFQLEQQYHIEKHKLHNRSIHGWGVVSGLKVSTSGSNVQVSPGLALDCEGNEVVVHSEMVTAVGQQTSTTIFVAVEYWEECVNPSPISGDFNEIEESASVHVLTKNSNECHRHNRGRWLSCGTRHPVTIARLRKQSGRWRVDRRYRVPVIK
jgi:hypothetical protein